MKFVSKVSDESRRLEEEAVSELNSVISNLKFASYAGATEHFKNDLFELAQQYPETFLVEYNKMKNQVIFKVASEERSLFVIDSRESLTDECAFSVYVRGKSSDYMITKMNNNSTYKFSCLQEVDILGFDEIIINKDFKLNLINAISKAINN
ncbi:hypothetical protein [Exiguobacterium sp. s133]|uniref:hypothetical protein n=1 Tax=Exiguobacterium sp. s133 TaxID=2751213 RepID=UPI001BE67E8D|nr:hypothetical protein [Exiguobacterium sp. s133]